MGVSGHLEHHRIYASVTIPKYLSFACDTCRVSQIANNLGVDLACWEDGLYSNNAIINKTRLSTDVVYTNAWDNVWEWGAGDRAYALANAGYKVSVVVILL